MAVTKFPPVELADEHGLLAVGGDLEVETLLLAYRSGIFPWPMLGWDELPWFAPPKRALLFFDELHLPKRLIQRKKNSEYSMRIDTAFSEVIAQCSRSPNRKRGNDTWITEEMQQAYLDLHQAGFAHSVECFNGDALVGGLYGVSIGLMFAGESMFHTESDASKLCLLHLIDHLQRKGATWLDCQQLTPLLEQFGARLVARPEFSKRLKQAVSSETSLFP